jgi:4-alpha-glucanotransferase
MTRRAGVSVPLFSIRSTTGWGIGELGDVVPLSRWLARCGFSRLMLLPLGTIPDGETSPYSATSTLSIDPMYAAIEKIPDFERAGGLAAVSPDGRRALEAARTSPVVLHDAVRRAKNEALLLAFSTFLAEEWEQLTTRAASLAAYMARERWWLDDYALFQAVSRARPGLSWRQWPAPLRDREARAIEDARRQFSREILQQQYWQWVAESQWQAARAEARAAGIAIIGDLPFVAGTESPEVWSRADEFMIDVSAGVPPDAFSESGQDWGLPTYRWDAIARSGYSLMRQRARRMAALVDGLRIDHVVGLYRTYARPASGDPFFVPADEPAQLAQGEAVIGVLRENDIELIAEDLGAVPDFVRASLTAMGVPGCRVLRWERQWSVPGAPFLDPEQYPALSVAMTGTHDTEPLAVWWDRCAIHDRAALLALPFFAERGLSDPSQPWTPALRDALLEQAFRSGSAGLLVPIQDLFGWPDRINTPATIGPQNWTWTLPWPVDRVEHIGEAGERARFLHALALSSGRTSASDYTRAQSPTDADSA